MSSRRSTKRAAETSPRTAKVVRLSQAEAAPALGSGAHFAKLSRKVDEARYEAELFSGERITVGVAPEVDIELVDRCVTDQDIVLVGLLGAEVVVFGALRTREKKPETVLVEAPRKLVLRAGKSKLELSADGKMRLSGDALTVDAPREVTLATGRVVIP